MKTCGECAHARLVPNDIDLTHRTCRGGPPQIVVLPGTAANQLRLVPMYPNITVNDEACGAFKPKPALIQKE